jgi:AraC-like DNA-binding protein
VGYDGLWDLLGVENGAKSMAAEPTVDARWACLVADLLEAKQIEPEGLLRQAGLSRRQVSDPDQRIPFRKHALLFELAAEACKDPYFGLKLGARVDVREAGLLGYVALSSLTFGQALKNVVRYHRILTEGFQLSFEFDQHHAVLAAIPADPWGVGRQAVEFGTSVLVRMCRDLTAQKLIPLRVQFVHPPPRAKARYAAFLKAPVDFEQPRIEVVFPKEVLPVPVKSADHRLLRILEAYCREILGKRAEESDIVFDVREVLIRLLSGGVPTLEQIAAEVNTSVRTLERRLKAKGWTYKQLVDDLRRQLALRYVKDPRLRLSQLGFLLGFSEYAAFVHAFRRWTGSTPMRYRAANARPPALAHRHRPAPTP